MRAKTIYESILVGKSEEDVLNSMISQDYSLKDILFCCVKRNILAGVKYTIEKGVIINTRSYQFPHKTALIYAATKGHKDIVQYLLENGADVNKKDFYNMTPLSYAKSNDGQNVVKLLKQYGAK